MNNNIAVRLENISKLYKLYDSPKDRLKEALHPFRKRYHSDFFALQDIDLEIRKGEGLGIIGRNGSGKSTLLQILCGVLQPSTGSVHVNGTVGALLELGGGFNPEFTGRENVYLNGAILGFSCEDMDKRFDEIASFADIGDFIDQPVKTYSSGMYIRLAFSLQVCIEPDILVVDEAISVGDIFFQQKCFKKIQRILETGTTLLFVSHNMAAVQRLCQSALLLKKGRMEYIGSPVEAASLYQVNETNGTSNDVQPSRSRFLKGHDQSEGKGKNEREDIFGHNILRSAKSEHGEKGIELVAASVQNEQGDYSFQCPIMKTITIKVLAKSHSYVELPNFGVTLIDRMNTVVFSSSSWQKDHRMQPMAPGEERIVTFKLRLSIQPGKYALALGAAEVNSPDALKSITHHRMMGLGPVEVYAESAGELLPFHGMANLEMEVF